MDFYTGIGILLIMFLLVMYFLNVQRQRTEKLNSHEKLYKLCVEKERDLIKKINDKFDIPLDLERGSDFIDISKLIEEMKFRYTHLVALAKMGQVDAKRYSLESVNQNYNEIINQHNELINFMDQYTNEYGVLDRPKYIS